MNSKSAETKSWVSISLQEPKEYSKNLTKSLSELLAEPSAILDGTDIQALLN